MRRTGIALGVVVVGLLVWIGLTRDTVAQVPQQVGSGRYTVSLVSKVPAGSGTGYYAILLDTHTGRMWASVGGAGKIEPFEPVRGPMDPRRPAQGEPPGQPGR